MLRHPRRLLAEAVPPLDRASRWRRADDENGFYYDSSPRALREEGLERIGRAQREIEEGRSWEREEISQPMRNSASGGDRLQGGLVDTAEGDISL